MLTQVAEGVRIHRSELLQNNAVIVEGATGVLVIDPGITRDELASIAEDVREGGRTVVAGFATHPDWDHVLWHPGLGDVPRYGTARCAAAMAELLSAPDWRDRVIAALPPEIVDDPPVAGFGRITALSAGAVRLPWDGPAVRVIEHRGHSVGHAALVIEERRVLVAGDMLSDLFVPMLDMGADDPIQDYLAALDLLDAVAGDVDVVIPGHGSVATGEAVRTRIHRDRAYVRALRDGHVVTDPRIGAAVEPGWEWVTDIHEGQAAALRARSDAGGTSARVGADPAR